MPALAAGKDVFLGRAPDGILLDLAAQLVIDKKAFALSGLFFLHDQMGAHEVTDAQRQQVADAHSHIDAQDEQKIVAFALAQQGFFHRVDLGMVADRLNGFHLSHPFFIKQYTTIC